MSSFAGEIASMFIEQIKERQKPDNPLVTIGFSPIILDLGLSDSELQDFCRSFARDLLAHFHEERVTKDQESDELQKRYAWALTELRRPDKFLAYLSEFRARTANDRSALNAEIRVNLSLRLRTRETEDRLRETEEYLQQIIKERSEQVVRSLEMACLLAENVQIRSTWRPEETIRSFEACSVGSCE